MEKEDELDWLADETNKITSNMSTLYRNIMLERERLSDFTHVSSDWLWETDADLQLTFLLGADETGFLASSIIAFLISRI